MASPRAERIAARYRERVARIRAAVDRELGRLYGTTIDANQIDESFARFLERAEPVIAGGQASIAATAAAFVRSVGLTEADELVEVDPLDLAGTTREGKTLADGMAAIAPMVLGQIADGKTVDQALEFGQYLVSRFADNEATGAADRELEHQGSESGPLVGWEGIVSPDACDPCQENAGEHDLDWQPYRHGSCNCTVVPVFERST